ncbi:hypothetical protein BDZ97DRAFT_2079509 [Flammula alnicola]|nr:hypothetical protein BDZ97DRAFT_2079509 [Flammula alnicola]
MSATGIDSYNPRTYGKRSGVKRKQETSFDPEPKGTSSANAASTKRRKVSAEPVARTPSPHKTAEDVATDKEDSPHEYRKLKSQSQSTIHENVLDRTPSLPNIPSSPSKPAERVASTSKLNVPLLPLIPSTTKSSTTRTYAGKFRSFLVPLPSSSMPNSQTLEEDEGFDTRESYSSLRNRWGVDNSEDDPYPYMSPSPTKSNSATPDISPSRGGKGKSKAASSAVRLPPIPYGMSNPLKSISELRNKGESRRFLDEVGYLFEGMDKKGGLALRRASALEITTKLCDPDFTRKAKAADFFTRTWDLFLEGGAGKGEDKILDILLVFFASLVARDSASLSELSQRPPSTPPSPSMPSKRKANDKEEEGASFFGTLFSILGTTTPDHDPLILVAPQSPAGDIEFKKSGINKKDRSMLTTVYKTIRSKSNLFPAETPISTSLLISYTLQSLPSSMMPSKYFPTFLASLRLSLCPIPSTTLSSSLSLKWLDAAKAVPYQSVYYHLRLLDTYLLHQWDVQPNESSQNSTQEANDWKQDNEDEMNKAREDWLADDLVAFGICIEISEPDDESESFPIQTCLDTTLRVLVSLTHGDELWGRKVVHSDYTMGFLMRTIHKCGRELHQSRSQLQQEEDADVKKEDEDEGSLQAQDEVSNGRADTHALDTLCLALGLLTNLVQIVEPAKNIVRETCLKPSCPLKKRACAGKCTCSQPLSGIEILVDLYSQQQIKIEASTVPLSEESPEFHAEAEASFLRGHLAVLFGLLMTSSPENQSAILAALPSSVTMTSPNAKKMKAAKRAKFTRLVEQAKDFTAFYTAVSNNIGGEKESKVAKEVVRFLETQRDAFI